MFTEDGEDSEGKTTKWWRLKPKACSRSPEEKTLQNLPISACEDAYGRRGEHHVMYAFCFTNCNIVDNNEFIHPNSFMEHFYTALYNFFPMLSLYVQCIF